MPLAGCWLRCCNPSTQAQAGAQIGRAAAYAAITQLLQAVMGAVRVLVTFSSSPTAIVPDASEPKFHPKNTSCFHEPMADHPRVFPDLQAPWMQWGHPTAHLQ